MVGVGLNATDTLIPLSNFPARGSKVEYSTASILPGGQVASTVVACQQWGMSTRYVGKLGDDHAAQLHRDAFARWITRTTTVKPGATMPPFGMLPPDDVRALSVYLDGLQ